VIAEFVEVLRLELPVMVGLVAKSAGPLEFQNEIYVAEEQAFAIDTQVYLEWLLASAQRQISITHLKTSLMEVLPKGKGVEVRTHDGQIYQGDHILFCGGVYQSYWGPFLSDVRITKGKCVQGSYLDFSEIDLGETSFSLTLEGNNLIYHAPERILLIGSTTLEALHHLPPTKELRDIYLDLSRDLRLTLPSFERATVKTGLREKAPRRLPYLLARPEVSAIGGFYKNGFTLSLEISSQWLSHITSTAEK
jgi:glycine/D-amino acid oxidase-like deaminating enzyme